MPSYKTGNSRTLTIAGTWRTTGDTTGLYHGNEGEYFIVAVPFVSVFAESEVSFRGEVDPNNSGAWTISIRQHDENTLAVAAATIDSVGFDFSGAFTLTVPNVEQWCDYAPDDSDLSGPTINAGVFCCPTRGALRLYEIVAPGTTAAARMTSAGMDIAADLDVGGLTLSYAPLISAALAGSGQSPVSLDGGVNFTHRASGSHSVLDVRVNYDGLAVAGGESFVADASNPEWGIEGVTCRADNLSGAHLELSLVAADQSEAPYTYSDPSIQAPWSVRAYTTTGPPRSFSAAGRLFSVSGDFPGTVPVNFPRYTGDPAPQTSASPAFSRADSQKRHSATLSAYADVVTDGSLDSIINQYARASLTASVNEWAPISATVDGGWCLSNEEYVTVQNSDGVNESTFNFFNDVVYLHGWQFPGLTLSLPDTPVDDCGNLTVSSGSFQGAWTGAALADSGGIIAATAAPVTRSLTPFANFTAYRFLRVSGKTTAGGKQVRTLTLGGKSFPVTFWPRASGSSYCDVDLLAPSGVAPPCVDTTDTFWPSDNPTLHYGADAGTDDESGGGAAEGPLWGVNYPTSLTFSGFPDPAQGGPVETVTGLDLVTHGDLRCHYLTEWEPRSDRLPESIPQSSVPAADDGDTLITYYALRGLVCDTDGRQSLELQGLEVVKVEGGSSGVISWLPHTYSIADWAALIAAGGQGAPTGPGDAAYKDYQLLPSGWAATVSAPAPDGSGNVGNDLLNSSSPAHWLMGAGALYTALPSGEVVWKTGVGLAQTSPGAGIPAPAQFLCTSVDWYPGCGDVFGLGGASPAPGTLYLGASWISRAQARGVVIAPPMTGTTASVQLAALSGGQQPPGEVEGRAAPDVANFTSAGEPPDGYYRTTGNGLVGQKVSTFIFTSTPDDGPGVPETQTRVDPAAGQVTFTYSTPAAAHAPAKTQTKGVSQTFHSRYLARVAAMFAPAPAALTGGVANLAHRAGTYFRVAPRRDVSSGNLLGLGLWRRDTGAPTGPGGTGPVWDIAASPVTNDPGDSQPSIDRDSRGRLMVAFTRAAADGTSSVMQALSDDDGATFSDPA